jgi:hypothetical protein
MRAAWLIATVWACSAPSQLAKPKPPIQRCDVACWRSVLGFLAETCSCTTEDCAYRAGKRMIAWVDVHIIEPQQVSGAADLELQAEFQPYWDVENACLAKLPPRP